MSKTKRSLSGSTELLKPIHVGLAERPCLFGNWGMVATASAPLRSTVFPRLNHQISFGRFDDKVFKESLGGIDSLLTVGRPAETETINRSLATCLPDRDISSSTEPLLAPVSYSLVCERDTDDDLQGSSTLVKRNRKVPVAVHQARKVSQVRWFPLTGISPRVLSFPNNRVSVFVATDHVVTSNYRQHSTSHRVSSSEGVETSRVSPNNNPDLERPARKGRHSPILVERPAKYTGKNAAGHDNAIYHRDAMALAWRVKPMTQNFDDIDTLSHQTAIQTIFGVVEVRDDHGVWCKGA
jgi:hypothetical protein